MNILVVDDNAESASALARDLRRATGHEVFTAVGADEAMALSRNDHPLDILISEVVLPSGDGFSLRESLRADRPDLRTIYITGYDLSEYQEYLNGTPVFYKPVTVEQLMAEIPAALVGPDPGRRRVGQRTRHRHHREGSLPDRRTARATAVRSPPNCATWCRSRASRASSTSSSCSTSSRCVASASAPDDCRSRTATSGAPFTCAAVRSPTP